MCEEEINITASDLRAPDGLPHDNDNDDDYDDARREKLSRRQLFAEPNRRRKRP